MAILLAAILILVSSLVLYWLGWTWPSGLLLLAFIFSLRDILFVRSVRIDDMGIALSHPLTGARHWEWEELEPLKLHPDRLLIPPIGERVRVAPAPPVDLRARLQEWLDWQAADPPPGP
jgi:hypothetical protein